MDSSRAATWGWPDATVLVVHFPDELPSDGVTILPYDSSCATMAAELIAQLQTLVPEAIAIEHIGSTAVVGMSAKACIDLMVVVDNLDTSMVGPKPVNAGYRRRPKAWNNSEQANGRDWPKMVFAPPVGGPSCNIHVRTEGTPSVRAARLFRDFLLATPERWPSGPSSRDPSPWPHQTWPPMAR